MTGLNIPLATPQYNLVRSRHHAGNTLIKLFSNRIVLRGTINNNLNTPGVPWAQFNYTLISGSYASVLADQVLVIAQTNDLTLACNTWYGRVRRVPTSSIIYCNESSVDFTAGAYFWVLDTYYPQYRLSRPSTKDPATAVELWDYDETFERMKPAIVGLPTAVCGYSNLPSGKFRYAFDISQSFAAEYGASISSYAFTFNGTIAAGAANTPYIVYDFDVGEQWGKVVVTDNAGRNLIRHVAVQVLHDTNNPPDTGFGTNIRISRKIDEGDTLTSTAFAGVDSVLNNTFAIAIRQGEQFDGATRDLWQGSSATVTNKVLTSNVATLTAGNTFEVGQEVVVVIGDSVFDGTYLITARTATQFSYAKVNANVASTSASGLAVVNPRNVAFVGWFQRESDSVQSDPDYSVLSKASFTFVGLGARMAKIVSELLPIILSASPSQCGQINRLTDWRTYLHYLTRYTTIGNLSDLLVDTTGLTFEFPAFPTVKGNVLSNLLTIGKQTNTFITFGPEGAIAFKRSAEFLSQTARNALTVVATWQAQDILDLTRDYEPDPNTGLVDGDAAFYNPTSGQVTVFTTRAPGIAQGEAPSSNTLSTQVLGATANAQAALDEIAARVGVQLLIDNNQEVLRIKHPGTYVGVPFICSRSQLYVWLLDLTLAGPNGVNRIKYDATVQWWIESVTETFEDDLGGFYTEVQYRRLVPVADPGDNTTLVAENEVPLTLPDFGLPAFDFDFPELSIPDAGLTLSTIPPAALVPPKGKIVTFTGQEVLIWDDDQVAFLRNFINLTTPQSSDITPGAPLGNIIQGTIDPFFTDNAVPGYLLESNGSDSRVAWNPNIATPNAGAAWLDGVALGDAFGVIRTTNVNGAVLVCGASTGLLPPPPPPNCIDPAAFPLYATLIYGAYGTPGYSSAQNLRNTTSVDAYGLGVAPYGVVRYSFSGTVTVTRVKVRAYSTTGDGFFVRAYFYNGTTLLQQTTVPGPFGNTSWVLFDLMSLLSPGPSGPVANVTKVEVAIWGNNSDLYRLSDADICYE